MFPYKSRIVEQEHELDGSLIRTVTTDYVYDNYGNPTAITTQTEGGGQTFTKVTSNTYGDDQYAWYLGRLTQSTVTSTTPDGYGARTSAFEYDLPGQGDNTAPFTGLLTAEIVEPDGDAAGSSGNYVELRTEYEYDAVGNRTVTRQRTSQGEVRTTTVAYDPSGRFKESVTNALGHGETHTYDARFGKPVRTVGPNDVATEWDYDEFGRVIAERSMLTRDAGGAWTGGTSTGKFYEWCTGSCLADYPDGSYTITVSPDGRPTTTTVYDKWERVIGTITLGFDGSAVYTHKEYDALGRVRRESRPRYHSEPKRWTEYEYDALNRATVIRSPDGSLSEKTYAGLATTTYDARGNAKTEYRDALDRVVEVVDALGSSTEFAYDPFDNRTEVRDPAGNVTTIEYDVQGRKIVMDDPDMGRWKYRYDAFGSLIWQQDAKGQIVELEYDRLGRLERRKEPEGTTYWTYDNQPNGIGKLGSVTAPLGYTKTITYNPYTLPETTTIGDRSVTTTYDGYGRVATITYPEGFTVEHRYSVFGYLDAIARLDTDTVLWQAEARNAANRVTVEELGNGLRTTRRFNDENGFLERIVTGSLGQVQHLAYDFDALGNLTERRDWNIGGAYEGFTYDALNRLSPAVVYTRTGQEVTRSSYSYDALGNVETKSDVSAGTFVYGENGAGPHAVTTVPGYATFTYDANGNMTGGAGRSITYTSFNKPSHIVKGNTQFSLYYGADRSKFWQDDPEATTFYLGRHYEKAVKKDTGVIEHRYYVYAGKRRVAMVTQRDNGTAATRYLHTDHQGSVETITDEGGDIVEKLGYGPFGARRGVTGDTIDVTVLAQVTRYGYTGHEHLDAVGLIDMNGRMYDPKIGRFISPDPHVQSPDNLQSYNRYSYALNNPLSYTDPSGFFLDKLFDAISDLFNAIFNIVVGAVLSTVMTPIAAGFVMGLITGKGDIRAGIIGAISAGMFQAIHMSELQGMGKVLAHGIAGGAMSALQGGKFKHGFLAAGFTQFASQKLGGWFRDVKTAANETGARAYNAVIAAMIGGTASVLGGGKFAGGAMTGAFSRMFNDDGYIFDEEPEIVELPDFAKDRLASYFPDTDLDNVRVVLDVDRVPAGKAALTWGNTIYMRPEHYDPYSAEGLALLGHELVHVCQYDKLGITGFLAQYTSEYAANRSVGMGAFGAYRNISLEITAYGMQAQMRFDFKETIW